MAHCVLRRAEDHFIIVSDDKSLPLVTFRLNEEKMKEKKRTYTECAVDRLYFEVSGRTPRPNSVLLTSLFFTHAGSTLPTA